MIINLNESKINELNEKYRDLVSEHPEWEKAASTRNKGHVLGVQTFAKKIGYEFPEHDLDKFSTLYVPYILISIGYNKDFNKDLNIDDEMDSFMRWATFSHVTGNSHHPEYWDSEAARDNSSISYRNRDGKRNTLIDATKMDEKSMIEMCCDWSSVGAEKGNSPQSWFTIGLKDKWIFTEEQQKFIWKTLEELWPGGSEETSKIEHKERYFNDNLWEELNKMWEKYSNKSLKEEYNFNDFENTIRMLAKEKENVSNIVGKLTSRDYEPTVNLQGVGSLQALSFLFSPSVTNYVMNLLDSIVNNNYSELASNNVLKSINLDKVEFGSNYSTRSKITGNFINGIMKSLDKVNSSKLNNKILLVNKFINNLKKHAKTIGNKIERQEYLQDIKSFLTVVNIVKNIVTNRNSFINVLNKTLLLQESGEEVVSEMFLNIYEGI